MIGHKLVLLSAISLALGLAGCGGGGGSSSTPPTNTASATIGGTAAKGIVINGVVTAVELDASGAEVATVGNAVTGNDGTYSLTLNGNYKGGPIQISITADSNTQTKCDVAAGCGTRTDGLSDTNSSIDFGELYKPAALTITALVPSAQPNETLSVSVTPFTHMAAIRAKSATTLDATTIANANSEVSNLLGGIDILNTPPVDITDSAAVSAAASAQITYAALASALSNQGLVDANGQPDLDGAINLLANSFATGVIEADDTNGDDAAQISLQEIVTAAEQTFTQAGITDTTGKLDGMQSIINYAESGDGIINPEPSSTAADANLVKVKAMMSDVRTWGNVIKSEAEARGRTFDTQVTLASDAINILGTTKLSNTLNACMQVALRFNGSTNLNSYNLGLNTFSSGSITSTPLGEITITGGVVHGYNVNMAINLPADTTNGTNFTLTVVSANISSPENSVTITNGVANIVLTSTYTIDYSAIDLGTSAAVPDLADLTFNLDNISFTQNVGSTGAALASPVSFSGSLAFDLDVIPVTNNPLNNEALPKTFNLTGVISNTLGDSLTGSLAANVTNTSTFQFVGDAYPAGTLYSSLHGTPMIKWTYSDTDATAGDDTFSYSTPYQNQSIYWNASNMDVTTSYTYQNYFTSLTELVVNYGSIYNDYLYVPGEGQYSFSAVGADTTIDGSLEGVLDSSEDPTNFPVGTLYSANHAVSVVYWSYTDTDAIAGIDTFTVTRSYGITSYYRNAADNNITQSNTSSSSFISLADVISFSTPYDVYTWVDGEGNYTASVAGADFSVSGEVAGTLVDPEFIAETNTANGWIDANLGLTFTLQLSGLPQSVINITADRTGFQAGNAQVTISYGDRQLALSGDINNSQVNGSLTITNQDNVVLNFSDTNINVDGPSLSGTLSLNGVEYGTMIETDSGYLKISYNDGTFEIF